MAGSCSEVASKVSCEVEAVLPVQSPVNVTPPQVEADADRSKDEVWPWWKLALLAFPQVGFQVQLKIMGSLRWEAGNLETQETSYLQKETFKDLDMGALLLGVFAFAGPLVGAWSDSSVNRWGRRRPIVIGGLLWTIVAGSLSTSLPTDEPGLKPANRIDRILHHALEYAGIVFLQTPLRALVSDCAPYSQQLPMQAVFALLTAIGNLVATLISWDFLLEHGGLTLLMLAMICGVCFGIQSLVAKKEQFVGSAADQSSKTCCCDLVLSSVKGQPRVFYILIAVQCLLGFGVTSVSDLSRTLGGFDRQQAAAAAVLQLLVSCSIMAILLYTAIPHRFIYAPTVCAGAAISLLAFRESFPSSYQVAALVASAVPSAAMLAIPYGLVALWNKRAESQGRQSSTAMQMALLDFCKAEGSLLYTLAMALVGGDPPDLVRPGLRVIAGIVAAIAGAAAFFLEDVEDSEDMKTRDVEADCEAGRLQAPAAITMAVGGETEQAPPAYLEQALCNIACRCPRLDMPICVLSLGMKPFNLVLQCIGDCINCMLRCWTRCVQCIRGCVLSVYRCICEPIHNCLKMLLYYLLCVPCIGVILKCCIAILIRFFDCCRAIIKCLVGPLKALLACIETCCAALWKCMRQCVISLWKCTTKCILAIVCCPCFACNKFCNPECGFEDLCVWRSKTSEVSVETTEEETVTVCCGGSAPGCVCIFPLECCGVGVTCPYACCSFGCTHCLKMPSGEKKYWKQKGMVPAGELAKLLAAASQGLIGGIYTLVCFPFNLFNPCMIRFKDCMSSCAPVKEAMKACLSELDVCVAPCYKIGQGCKVISADCHLGCTTVFKPCAPLLILSAPVVVPMKFVFNLTTKRMRRGSMSDELHAQQDLEKDVAKESQDIRLAVAVEQEIMGDAVIVSI